MNAGPYVTRQRAGIGGFSCAWRAGQQQALRACTQGKRPGDVASEVRYQLEAKLFGGSKPIHLGQRRAVPVFVLSLDIRQSAQACHGPLSAEIGAHGNAQHFKRDMAGEIFIDYTGVPAGDRLDHGCDSNPIEGRHDDAMLGEADKLSRQISGVGGNRDDRAAQLHCGRKFGAAGHCGAWLRPSA
jgi:hypothetical protein